MWDFVWTVEDLHNWKGNTLQFPYPTEVVYNAKESHSVQMFSLTWRGSDSLSGSIIWIKLAD